MAWACCRVYSRRRSPVTAASTARACAAALPGLSMLGQLTQLVELQLCKVLEKEPGGSCALLTLLPGGRRQPTAVQAYAPA